MPKTAGATREVQFTGLTLARNPETPLYQQIADHVRTMVLHGQAMAGARLPASREASEQLGVSRNTMVLAYEHLISEGYIEARTGAGSFIAQHLPDPQVRPDSVGGKERADSGHMPKLSRRGRHYGFSEAAQTADQPSMPFQAGLCDVDHFPERQWRRLYNKNLSDTALRAARPVQGHSALRSAIAMHLQQRRAVQCEADEVLVLSSSRQACVLISRLLFDEGDDLLMEHPGYTQARDVFALSGINILPQPVDADGLVVVGAPAAQGAFVTPSWQVPCGRVLSLERRLSLLAWAERHAAWIIEDDYDCEYRYCGYAQAALKSIDEQDCVIYIGTFNNSLYPALQLAYTLLPRSLMEPALRLKRALFGPGRAVEEKTLADFIDAGHFNRHMRRTRRRAAERQQALLEAAAEHLPEWVEISDDAPAGMHLVGWLPEGYDDVVIAGQLKKEDIYTIPVSRYAHGEPCRPGLLMFYTAHDCAAVRSAIARMGTALRELYSNSKKF